MINIIWETMFCGRRLFRRKMSMLTVLLVCWFTILTCRLYIGLFCFVKCFMMILNHLLNTFFFINSMAMLIYMVNWLWMFFKNSSNFTWNLINSLWHLKLYIIDIIHHRPPLLIFFSEDVSQFRAFCLNSAKG